MFASMDEIWNDCLSDLNEYEIHFCISSLVKQNNLPQFEYNQKCAWILLQTDGAQSEMCDVLGKKYIYLNIRIHSENVDK